MIGILSVGGHVPRYRLSGTALGAVWGGSGAGKRAVANYDEDSLTMSCEAAPTAPHGRDIKSIGDCFLASTSAPFAEKSSDVILAAVADLSPEVLTADLGRQIRRGSTAMREGTGEDVDDSVITTKVKTTIFNDSTSKVSKMNVEMFKGMVQLSGIVRSQADIDKAVQVARAITDVRPVKNGTRIK